MLLQLKIMCRSMFFNHFNFDVIVHPHVFYMPSLVTLYLSFLLSFLDIISKIRFTPKVHFVAPCPSPSSNAKSGKYNDQHRMTQSHFHHHQWWMQLEDHWPIRLGSQQASLWYTRTRNMMLLSKKSASFQFDIVANK